MREFEVIVIGAGHAGVEAGAASARVGARTALITKKIDNFGEMSCNPAVGGVAKGTIVREVDALDGVMGRAIDIAGIHFRILNESKGAAVHSPRAQADRVLYKEAIRRILREDYAADVEKNEFGGNLEVILGSVVDLLVENGAVKGVVLEDGERILAKSVVLTAGTFLNGVIHVGQEQIAAGRVGEAPSTGISERLMEFDFRLSRLKTGTPPRILKDSIDFSALEEQKGDAVPTPFSYLNDGVEAEQTSCFITYTNAQTHEIIAKNLEKSAMFGGQIASKGPRYCPSIEDKIFRFVDKDRHQIFLEPEGLGVSKSNLAHACARLDLKSPKSLKGNDYAPCELIYPNGISTSLPISVQIEFLRTIKGLENCVVAQAGYAIEYDFVDPRELLPSLETKKIRGLFFAGQINGTTGYEEAAGQGLIAGVNAAGTDLVLDRASSYIGVMIDDLTTLGVSEPYRMLTSRSEYRLSLRADNADLRLTEIGVAAGCVSARRNEAFLAKRLEIEAGRAILEELKVSPKKILEKGIKMRQDGVVRSGFELLSFPEIGINELREIFGAKIDEIAPKIQKQLEIEGLYAPYLKRQAQDVEVLRRDSAALIPLDIDYDEIKGLSAEVREKLNEARPQNIGAALRIQGVTPAAVMAILVFLRKKA